MFRTMTRIAAVSLSVLLSLVGAGMFVVLPAMSGGLGRAVPGIVGFVIGAGLVLFVQKRYGNVQTIESRPCT